MVVLAAAAFSGAGSLYSLPRSLPEEAEVGDARSSKRSEQATEAEEACPAVGGEENKGTGVKSWTCTLYYITLAGGVLYMYCMRKKSLKASLIEGILKKIKEKKNEERAHLKIPPKFL
jgi:ribosomal protein L37AE/L43A